MAMENGKTMKNPRNIKIALCYQYFQNIAKAMEIEIFRSSGKHSNKITSTKIKPFFSATNIPLKTNDHYHGKALQQ